MSEPLLRPGEKVDYFEVWNSLSNGVMLSAAVVKWADRTPSRSMYLEEIRRRINRRASIGQYWDDSIDEMISRMIVDINDIAWRERNGPG